VPYSLENKTIYTVRKTNERETKKRVKELLTRSNRRDNKKNDRVVLGALLFVRTDARRKKKERIGCCYLGSACKKK